MAKNMMALVPKLEDRHWRLIIWAVHELENTAHLERTLVSESKPNISPYFPRILFKERKKLRNKILEGNFIFAINIQAQGELLEMLEEDHV